jgi:hypothetical protein
MPGEVITISLPISLDASFGKFDRFFEDSYSSDVEFVVGKYGIRIHGHTNIIRNVNEVFRKLFLNEWKGKKEIILRDLKPEAFRTLLVYIYKDKIELEIDSLFHVLRAAYRFRLYVIVEKLMSRETFNLYCYRCVWQYLSFSMQKPGYTQIYQDCLNLIDSDAEFFLSMNDFTRLPAQVVSLVLARDSLIIDEHVLFCYCIKWSIKECKRQRLIEIPSNQRKVMETFIYSIRFPIMKMTNFLNHSRYLSFAETTTIFYKIVTKNCCKTGGECKPILTNSKFIARERSLQII